MLLGTLAASLLENHLIVRGIKRAGKSKEINRAGKGIVRTGYGKKNGFLMPPNLLTNFEIQKNYQNEPKINGVYSGDNLPKRSSTEINDGAYIIKF